MGGLHGGIAASQSKYERSIVFGGVTESGKQAFLNDLAAANSIYNGGVNNLSVDNTLGKGVNGRTVPVINGTEVDLVQGYLNGQGTNSNVYIKTQGKSLRAIESTFLHEMVHVGDLYSGYAGSYYRQSGNSITQTRLHLEMRGYQANVDFGYNKSTYLRELNKIKLVFQKRYGP